MCYNPGMAICEVHWFGMADYEEIWRLQERWAGEIAAGVRPATLLLLEHPHTFTMGRRSDPAHLLWSQAEIDAHGAKVFQVDRGGDITYHGPGQLVGYPLIPLGIPGGASGLIDRADYVGYIRKLEQVLIATAARFGIAAEARAGLTGVWVSAHEWSRSRVAARDAQPAAHKLASIGVKVDARGISRHGFALNVNTQPEFWGGIVACGLDGVQMANLADFCEPVPAMETVRDVAEACFLDEFDFTRNG